MLLAAATAAALLLDCWSISQSSHIKYIANKKEEEERLYIKINRKTNPPYCQRPLTPLHPPPHITITTNIHLILQLPMNIVSISFVLYKMYINFTFYILHKHTVHSLYNIVHIFQKKRTFSCFLCYIYLFISCA